MTNFIRGIELVGDSSACLQSGKDEFSDELRTFVDRSAQSVCRLCAMPFSANCECSLRTGIPLSLSSLAGSSGVTDERSRRSHGISDFFIFTSYPLLLSSSVYLPLDNHTGTCANKLPSEGRRSRICGDFLKFSRIRWTAFSVIHYFIRKVWRTFSI